MDSPRDPDFAARLFGARPEHTLALLRAAWPVAVGPEIARRTEVVAIDGSVLRVKVPDARWQRTLQRMRSDVLWRLRRVAGGAAPHALGFVLGPVTPAPEPPAPPPATLPTPVPSAIVAAASTIPDAEVRARFLAAAARYLARFAHAQAEGGSGTGMS
jgi:Dna[CI] antecedent, DciA